MGTDVLPNKPARQFWYAGPVWPIPHWGSGWRSRYETYLDRKFERTLAMLIKLNDLRSSRATQKNAYFSATRKTPATKNPCELQPVSWVFNSQILLNLPINFGKNRRIKMGGRGSGRRSSYIGKSETNHSMPLDISKITHKGLLVPASRCSWQWLVNDQKVAGISIRVNSQQSMLLSWCIKRAPVK